MQKIIVFILLLAISDNAIAKCGPGYIEHFPSNGKVKSGGWLILEMHGVYSKYADSIQLGVVVPVLKDLGGNRFPLELKQRFNGSFSCNQLILTVPKNLKEGVSYALIYEDHKGDANSNTWITRLETSFFSLDTDSGVPSGLQFHPRFVGNHYLPLGCGPAKWISLDWQQPDHGHYLIRCHLIGPGNTHQWCVLESQAEFRIGHDMCSGMFTFQDGQPYKVELELLDYKGKTLGVAKALSLKAPQLFEVMTGRG